MKQFAFNTVSEILVERGANERLGQILARRFTVGRVAVITDSVLVRCGLVDSAVSSLQEAGWQILVCDDVQADPPESVVNSVVEKARQFRADVVVGFGGGSSMDVAKLVAVLAGSSQALSEVYGAEKVVGTRLPLIQIPTTAGTGSEVTAVSVVTAGGSVKRAVIAQQLFADMAVLDATLTAGLPSAVAAATGIDAIVHAIEAFTNRNRKNALSDHAALLALRLLFENLPKAVRADADTDVRENMLLGAMLAGQAFANSPVAAVHALAAPLGGLFHISHGLSNALVLLHVLRFNLESALPAYATLGRLLISKPHGRDEEDARAFVMHVEQLLLSTGLPMRLRDHGVSEASLVRLSEDAMLQGHLLVNNPREVGVQDALAIYQAAY